MSEQIHKRFTREFVEEVLEGFHEGRIPEKIASKLGTATVFHENKWSLSLIIPHSVNDLFINCEQEIDFYDKMWYNINSLL